MVIVTSGSAYIDIDAYACCVAYAELLNLQGIHARAVSTAPRNESIPPLVLELNAPFETTYTPESTDSFVVVDLSSPSHFDTFVSEDRVTKIFDHHPGFEDYWTQKLGSASHIEFIGAAATLIYEQWGSAGLQEQMSQTSAQLLAAAILDNTLNFTADITTSRDRHAYESLALHANLNDAWVARYFSECQQAILANLPNSLRNDTKLLKVNALPKELRVGQLVLWDADAVIRENLQAIEVELGQHSEYWMINIINISKGRSYFVTNNSLVQTWLEKLLNVTFDKNIAIASRPWLRKEIAKAASK